jgi:hypothetical protein
MDGRVLTEALTSDRLVKRQANGATDEKTCGKLSKEEEAEVEDRLRALGYLG